MELNQLKIDELKNKYKHGLKRAVVNDLKGEKHTFVFRRINREEMDAAIKVSNQSMTKALEIQMTSSCVFGDVNLIMQDVEIFRALQAVWQSIQKECEVELGEL